MYGTIARIKLKDGAFAELQRLEQEMGMPSVPGFRFQHIYRLDSDPSVVILVVGFESKEAYLVNAQSPEQASRYEQYRSFMAADPEWSDGEIVSSFGG
jgi:heme-degrading monooxygenase HmoA